jgi:multicomponent Na+:H+ antiporter subunit D
VSEPYLFGKAKSLAWTGLLWMAGGLALAAAPGFLLDVGESHVTAQAPWAEALFFIAGVLTGGAVLRVGLRVFRGLGDAVPIDESAKVDEEPETPKESRIINWFLWLPPLLCIAGSVALTFWVSFANGAWSSAIRFMDFRSYAHAVYQQFTLATLLAVPKTPHSDLVFAGVRALLAIGVAFWTVFRLRIPRAFRWPSHLEGPMRPLREIQSGHPGDYVAWLTVGMTVLGAVAFWLGLGT